MEMALVLGKMTNLEKLQALEEIWTDLNQTPDEIPVPQWHLDVLAARETRLKSGQSGIADWESAKELIRAESR